MIVVLDTNICIPRTHLLGNELGRELAKLLDGRRGELFVPEILRREYFEQTTAATRDYEEGMEGKAQNIRTLLGYERRVERLSDEEIQRAVQERLRGLENLIRIGPTEDDLHTVTSRRVIAKKPPVTEKKHGHKDCMIWEAIRTLPAGSEVWIISNDGGFFDGDAFHPILLEEARDLNIVVHGHRTLDPLLQHLRAQTRQLDLAGAEAAEKAQNVPEMEPAALIPPAPAALPNADPPTAPGREVDEALERIRATFEQNDARVLGFIASLGAPRKQQLFELCEQAEMNREQIRNSAERLSQAAVVRDTGTHYLIPDAALAAAARARVLPEITQLLAGDRRRGP